MVMAFPGVSIWHRVSIRSRNVTQLGRSRASAQCVGALGDLGRAVLRDRPFTVTRALNVQRCIFPEANLLTGCSSFARSNDGVRLLVLSLVLMPRYESS